MLFPPQPHAIKGIAMGVQSIQKNRTLTVASLFSGIGGIELGMKTAGHHTELQCEILEPAREILRCRFPESRLHSDVTRLKSLPTVEMVTAGFPCQDLSQAGRTKGITGEQSSLIDHMFDLVRKKRAKPEWLLIENVPFMLQLDRGRGMQHLTSQIQALGYNWAYRTVDARSFGLPQRRRRVIILASRSQDPRQVLLSDEACEPPAIDRKKGAVGFYWTEGNTGLGLTEDGVPTLKGGSGLGIPSPPAIWLRDRGAIGTPDIRDAERLQGFPVNWTLQAMNSTNRIGIRWKLIGNAVSVPVARWIGRNLHKTKPYDESHDEPMEVNTKWSNAGWCVDGKTYHSFVSEWPKRCSYRSLASFLKYPLMPLSEKATAGFYYRIQKSSLRRPNGFDRALESHLSAICEDTVTAR
ncbi:MAG: DNA (cytosine-5-)-methyltransferase [Planctomycetaceae bacterium]|nr:DNA (cytosine-5-)-methyltransferase [Planctomycetaceae bacterium]